jgi:hypothetical protein
MLATQLHDIFAHYHAPNVRYKHLAFSSKNFSTLKTLQQTLQETLPDYEIWDDMQSESSMPTQGCSRFDFLQQTFHHTKPLLIFYPDAWLRYWSLQDQQAFWAQLSTQYGGKNIVVLFEETHDFTKQNNHYFLPNKLPNTEITLWISTKNILAD